MKTNYRQLIKARNDYIEENDWWQENKHYHIGEYFENIERINVKEAAKAYRIQLKKLGQIRKRWFLLNKRWLAGNALTKRK